MFAAPGCTPVNLLRNAIRFCSSSALAFTGGINDRFSSEMSDTASSDIGWKLPFRSCTAMSKLVRLRANPRNDVSIAQP